MRGQFVFVLRKCTEAQLQCRINYFSEGYTSGQPFREGEDCFRFPIMF